MEFPNFNYAAKLFRIDRKQKTICRRLCAVRRRPGATRIAALVPRKTESRTVVRQLQVTGPKIERNFKNRPTILIWRTRSWGNGGAPVWGKMKFFWGFCCSWDQLRWVGRFTSFCQPSYPQKYYQTLLHDMSPDPVHQKQRWTSGTVPSTSCFPV